MRTMATTTTIALLMLLAGCIELPQDPDALAREPATGGTMSASEASTQKSELCTDGILQTDRRFCAERVVEVEGRLSGFALLSVDLQTFNGAIKIRESRGSEWGFVATLRARGSSAEDAMAKVDDIDFRWAHQDGDVHFLEVVARHQGNSDSRSASLELRMPRDVAMRLAATTSNGDVSIEGGRTDGLALTTSNGKLVARSEVTQVALTTSNGAIDADLRPVGDGRWALVTSNGGISLKVPEGQEYGYSMDGRTSNGEVDYSLRDGTKGSCPQGSQYYTPPCNHRTFETRGFSSREHVVYASLVTSNGKISVGPA